MTGEEREITLGLLNAIHNNSNVTQRSVAKDLGVALGLANSYLKRCVKKGFVKIQQAPANRYAYYLTPKGFAEKTALTAEFLTQGFQFFRQARNQCTEIFTACAEKNWHRVALYGLTDVAEIAILCATNCNIEVIGIIEDSTQMEKYNDIPIVGGFSKLENLDAMVITDLGNPQLVYDQMTALLPKGRVLAPDFLNIDQREKFGRAPE